MEQSRANSVRVLDRAGMSASLACAVHCAIFPLLLSALGLAWLDSAWVDWTMVVLAAVIGLRAHRGGFRVHRRCLPAGIAVAGLFGHRHDDLPAQGKCESPLYSGFGSSG